MPTEVRSVDPQNPSTEVIAQAAAILRRGGLVAFPTETVYGLGASALDAAAVARIFAAKGRPAHNPLIVHIPDVAGVGRVAADWPAAAARLAERFWPGPLTLVLPRKSDLPDAVTAGGPTVAVRVPANAVALSLLRAADLPVAAPSANLSSELSPTRAEHVLRGLAGRVDLVLDGGPTSGGIESTVVDVTCVPPRLLRPGLIGPGAIETVIGALARGPAPKLSPGAVSASPGMLPKHYAPRTRLYCLQSGARAIVHELVRQGQHVGWIPFAATPEAIPPGVIAIYLADDPAGYAARLYDVLHTLDRERLDAIVVELPPATDEWLALRDRLMRAAADS